MSKKKFIACRIPDELDAALENYCKQQGVTRTDAIIQGVAQYVGFSLPTKPQPSIATIETTISEERFLGLEKTVVNLVQELADLKSQLEKQPFLVDNTNNAIDNKNLTDNYKEETLEESTISQEQTEEQEIYEERTTESLDFSNSNNIIHNNKVDNAVIKNEESINYQLEDRNKPKPLKNINTTRVGSISSLTRKQIQYLLEKTIEKLKQEDKLGEPGMFLPEPIEVYHKDGITVNGYPYKLFYIGEDSKERPLWDLLPDDNKSYQPVITELNYISSNNNND